MHSARRAVVSLSRSHHDEKSRRRECKSRRAQLVRMLMLVIYLFGLLTRSFSPRRSFVEAVWFWRIGQGGKLSDADLVIDVERRDYSHGHQPPPHIACHDRVETWCMDICSMLMLPPTPYAMLLFHSLCRTTVKPIVAIMAVFNHGYSLSNIVT